MKKKINALFNWSISKLKKEEQEKPGFYVWSDKPSAQYRLPTIKIIGNLSKEDIDEIRDFVIAHIVEEYFKDVPCHVYRFKGDTFIRLKNQNEINDDNAIEVPIGETTEMPIINNSCTSQDTMVMDRLGDKHKEYRLAQNTFVNEFKRNSNRYKAKF